MMTTVQASARGLAVHVLNAGVANAPRVVFVHGAMDTGASFLRLRDRLHDVDSVIYDRRGYGESRLGARAPFGVTEHVEDLLTVLAGRQSWVVAHSFGGLIALTAAHRHPELFHGLVAYESPILWESWWPAPVLPENLDNDAEVRAAAEAFLLRHMGEDRWQQLDEGRRAEFLGSAPAWAAELTDARYGEPPYIAEEIAVPVVVVNGTATDERHREATRTLAARIPGASHVEIPGATHLGHRHHASALAKIIRTHLDTDVAHRVS